MKVLLKRITGLLRNSIWDYGVMLGEKEKIAAVLEWFDEAKAGAVKEVCSEQNNSL